jgi:hypothetical protein
MKQRVGVVDPHEDYEVRWFSDGTPTALVRDGGVEPHDPPPDSPITGELQRVLETPPSGVLDLKRADEAETEGFDPVAVTTLPPRRSTSPLGSEALVPGWETAPEQSARRLAT